MNNTCSVSCIGECTICQAGLFNDNDCRLCIDDDECVTASVFPCGIGNCTNTFGSFQCDCPLGYELPNCTASLCPLGASGFPNCTCLTGFNGVLIWNATTNLWEGVCSGVACPANASGWPNNCYCGLGYVGTITWDNTTQQWSGGCTMVGCPPNAMGFPNCYCPVGYNGTIIWNNPTWNGQCTVVDCPVNTIGWPNCRCSRGWSGIIGWDSTVQSYTGSCLTVPCPSNALGEPNCTCNSGYKGTDFGDELFWDVVQQIWGSCLVVDCPVNAIGWPNCGCSRGCSGIIGWDSTVHNYNGSCLTVPCPSNALGQPNCTCNSGYKGTDFGDELFWDVVQQIWGSCFVRPCPANAIGEPNCGCQMGGSLIWDSVTHDWLGICYGANFSLSIDHVIEPGRMAYLINSGEVLRLHMNAIPFPWINPAVFTYSWSSPDVDVTALANIETVKDTEYLAITGSVTRQFGLITVYGTARMNGNDIITKMVNININSPPGLGTCVISPSTGTYLVTVFHLICNGWQDPENNPFAYSAFYATDTNPTNISLGVLQNNSALWLPAGTLTIRVYVTDSLGARALYNQPLTVVVTVVSNTGAVDCTVNDLNQTVLAQLQSIDARSQMLQVVNLLIDLMSDPIPPALLNCNGTSISTADFRQQLWREFLDILASVASQQPLGLDAGYQVTETLLALVDVLQSSTSQAVDIRLVIDIIEAVLNETTANHELGVVTLQVLSKLLDDANCSVVTTVADLIYILSTRMLEGTLPTDAAVSLLAPNLSYSGMRVDQSNNVSFLASNLTVSIPKE